MLRLSEAQDIAGKILELLKPACENIRIAGSVRRGASQVNDIEIVALPRLERPATLFGTADPVSALDARLRVACSESPLTVGGKSGQRYKRLHWGQAANIDLFIVRPPATWGAILAIRTGPADFVRVCVTARQFGGAMPPGMCQHDGQLLRDGKPLDTPTEESWFTALGLPQWEPGERTPERLQKYLARRPAPFLRKGSP